MVEGYNIGLKINSKTIAARTKDDLNISAITKESITKDDAGTKNIAVKGHDITFSVEALLVINSSGSTTSLDRDDLISLAITNGSSAIIPFTYACGLAASTNVGQTMTGNLIITSYSESSQAEADSDSTVTLNCKVVGIATLA